MTDTTDIPRLSYEERTAIATLRKAIKRDPRVAAMLLKDMSANVAVSVLKQARDELDGLLIVTRALSEASTTLARALKTEKEESHADERTA